MISISKPIPKVPREPPLEEPQSEITQTEEISLTEELQQPEPIDPAQPAPLQLVSTSYGGWKPSDILLPLLKS